MAAHASPAVVGDFGSAAWSVPKLRANFTTRRFLKKALSLDENYPGFVAATEAKDQCLGSTGCQPVGFGDSPKRTLIIRWRRSNNWRSEFRVLLKAALSAFACLRDSVTIDTSFWTQTSRSV
jgi:hypothetical protein